MGPVIPMVIMTVILFVVCCIIGGFIFLIVIPLFFKNSKLNNLCIEKKRSYILKSSLIVSFSTYLFVLIRFFMEN